MIHASKIGVVSATAFVLSMFGCVEDIAPPTPPPITAATVRCIPDTAVVGEVITIVGGRFAVPAYQNFVKFSNAIEDRADSGTDSSIVISVPFGAQDGPVKVETPYGEYLSAPFHMREVYNSSKLNAVWYNLSPGVVPADSSVIDPMGFRNVWRARMLGDTIIVQREHHFGELYAIYYLRFLHRGTDRLPWLETVWVYSVDDTWRTRTDTVKMGMAKIQDRDPGRAISGKFISEPWEWGPFTFWVGVNNIGP